MKPTIAVQITDVDKTGAGRKSAEKGFAGLAKRTEAMAKTSGFAGLGGQLDSLGKVKSLSFGDAGRGLSFMAGAANDFGKGLAAIPAKAAEASAASNSSFAGIQAGATAAAEVVGGLTLAIGAAAMAAYGLGQKWAGIGSEVDRTSKSIGESAEQLQAWRGTGERFGVSADQTTSGLGGAAQALYQAKYGQNNKLAAAMQALGVTVKKKADGTDDLDQFTLDWADAIKGQKDPQVQRELAETAGMGGMLPVLRQGSDAIKTQMADYNASGSGLSGDEAAKASGALLSTTTLKQHLGALEKTAGLTAMAGADIAAKSGLAAQGGAGGLPGAAGDAAKGEVEVVVSGARDLVTKGFAVAEHGAQMAGGAFMDFARRIEHQESRGHQLDKHGHPLTSEAGAIGAMQMLPKTAQRTAEQHGVAWDPERFRTDKAYNEQLGADHLADLTAKYGGDETLAATAYNAGEGVLDGPYKDRQGRRHESWLKRFGDPRKGEISDADFAAKIPFSETRDYVAKTVPARAQIEITLKGAPKGTVTRVTSDPGVTVIPKVVASMTPVP